MDFLIKFANSFGIDQAGSSYMWAILLVGFLVLAISIDRYLYIFVKSNINASKFMDEIRRLIKAGDLQKAINLCKSAQDKALATVVLVALEKAKEVNNFRAIQNAVDEGSLAILPKLNKRTNLIQTFSNVATLLGLMGTIYGLILCFDSISNPAIPAVEKSRLLAEGIAVAMYTTLFGLAIAIPGTIIFQIIANKTSSIIEDIDEQVLKLVNLLTGE